MVSKTVPYRDGCSAAKARFEARRTQLVERHTQLLRTKRLPREHRRSRDNIGKVLVAFDPRTIDEVEEASAELDRQERRLNDLLNLERQLEVACARWRPFRFRLVAGVACAGAMIATWGIYDGDAEAASDEAFHPTVTAPSAEEEPPFGDRNRLEIVRLSEKTYERARVGVFSNATTVATTGGELVESFQAVELMVTRPGSCRFSMECVWHGACGDGQVCRVVDAADCAASYMCERKGECSKFAGRCSVLSDADCARSLVCHEGHMCTAELGKCVQ